MGAMAMEDQDPHDNLGFFWENQSWDLSNFENSDFEIKNKFFDITNTTTIPQNELVIGEPSNEGSGGESNAVKNNNNKRDITAVSDGKRVVNGEGGEGKSREADHELHIWTERERRKKMRNMFANLHAMLPQLPPKADKSRIIDEAVKTIKYLQKGVENLEQRKRERNQLSLVSPMGCESSVISSHWNPFMDSLTLTNQPSPNALPLNNNNNNQQQVVAFKTLITSPNLVMTMFSSHEAQYNICATKKQGLSTTIAFVLEKFKLDVIYGSVFSNENANSFMILAHANKALVQFQDAASVEETFKRAASEIMMWLS